MSNCRWWIKGISNFRIFEKNVDNPYHDGVKFYWNEWSSELTEVRNLKPGEPIWNPYLSSWDSVKKVHFKWKPIYERKFNKDTCEESFGKILGKYISYFHIETEKNYIIYDTPSFMKKYCKNYGKEK